MLRSYRFAFDDGNKHKASANFHNRNHGVSPHETNVMVALSIPFRVVEYQTGDRLLTRPFSTSKGVLFIWQTLLNH